MSFGMKNIGYSRRNRFGIHHVGSNSPASTQYEIACRPDVLVSTREIIAKDLHRASFRPLNQTL
jgi:hypothetical protein